VLYPAALCYVALVFLRLSEVIPGWGGMRLVLGASILVAPLIGIAWWRRSALPIDLPHDRWLLAYWLAIGVSNIASGWLGGALLGVEQFAHVAFLYFLLRTAITTPTQLRTLIVVLTSCMLFHAGGAIVQHHTGIGLGGVRSYMERGAPRSRSVGIFNDPNDLALGLLMVLPFLLAGVFGRSVSRRHRTIAAAVTIPMLLGFYYANSRGGLLGLAVSVSVYCWRRFGVRRGLRIAAAAVIVLIALAPSRIGMVIHLGEVSAQGRLQAWTAGLEMLRTHPLTGVGWGRYAQHYGRPAHNSYLHAFAELGVLGGWCFVAIVYSYFWGLRWRQPRTDEAVVVPSTANVEDALLSAGAGFFVDAFFLSQQYSVMTFSMAALGAVYLSVIAGGRRSPVIAFGRREWLAVAGIALAILVGIWMSVHVLAIKGG
jgi:O-antigen ligase